jgi:hypothetical protein
VAGTCTRQKAEIDEKVWLISFMRYDLGFFDHEGNRFECAEDLFAAKVVPRTTYLGPIGNPPRVFELGS